MTQRKPAFGKSKKSKQAFNEVGAPALKNKKSLDGLTKNALVKSQKQLPDIKAKQGQKASLTKKSVTQLHHPNLIQVKTSSNQNTTGKLTLSN